MKQIYYITFKGRYEINGRLSKKSTSFSLKDTYTDFKAGNTLLHKGRFFHIDEVIYEPMKNCYR